MELHGLDILVTGGAGFIGSHLVDRLIEMDNHVIVYDNFDDFYLGKEKNIQNHLNNSNFTLINADILDYERLVNATNNIDIIFHLAAQAGVRYSLEYPLKTNTINTTGTLNVLRAAKQNNIKKIIFASSSSVCGDPQYMPVDEKHPTNPVSIYGASKLIGEKYCQILSNAIILRYHTVYGPRQRPEMAIHKWIRGLFANEAPIIYGDGEQTRDFTYIDDIIDGTLQAAETEGIEKEIFNLGSGRNISVNKLINLLLKLTNKEEIKPIYSSPKVGDVPDTYADITKAKNILGYSPDVALENGIQQFIEWYKFQTNQ